MCVYCPFCIWTVTANTEFPMHNERKPSFTPSKCVTLDELVLRLKSNEPCKTRVTVRVPDLRQLPIQSNADELTGLL